MLRKVPLRCLAPQPGFLPSQSPYSASFQVPGTRLHFSGVRPWRTIPRTIARPEAIRRHLELAKQDENLVSLNTWGAWAELYCLESVGLAERALNLEPYG